MIRTDIPIVFVPGLGATGEVYRPFLRRLEGQYDVRVAMHSLKLPARLDWQFFFRAIDQAAGSASRFVLLGHSMGGNTALAYAAQHSERVVRTIVVSPPVLPKTKVRLRGPARFRTYRRLQSLMLGLRGADPGHAIRVIRIRQRVLAGGRRARLYDWINSRDLRHQLSKVRNGIVLWPKREEILAREHYETLRQYPNIDVRLIAGSHNNLALYPQPIMVSVLEALSE